MAIPVLFTNNASSRLAAAIDPSTTSVSLRAGDGVLFPQPAGNGSNYFTLTVEDRRTGQLEIMHCTARTNDVLTVIRGREGTGAQAFAMHATASNRLTAGVLTQIIAHINA
jgi:hypothetical protein